MVTTKGLVADHRGGQELAKAAEAAGGRSSASTSSTRRTASRRPATKRRCSRRTMAAQTWTPVAGRGRTARATRITASISWIAFANPKVGIVTGWNLPPRHESAFPDWLDPEDAMTAAIRRTSPISLDHAATAARPGRPSAASLFGQVTRVRLSARGHRPRAGRVFADPSVSGGGIQARLDAPGRARRSFAIKRSPSAMSG